MVIDIPLLDMMLWMSNKIAIKQLVFAVDIGFQNNLLISKNIFKLCNKTLILL